MNPELLLVFSGGLLGSAHCVGMCGGFALTVGAYSTGWAENLTRQLVYSAGRIATYTTIGAIAGFLGLRMSGALTNATVAQAILAVVAGALLISQGLLATGVWRRKTPAMQHPCLLPTILREFLKAPSWMNVFFAGVFTGFLPCGLVYAFLALASTTQSMFTGWLLMLAFGLGTVPIMVLTGIGAGVMTLAARRRVLQWAGWCVVVAGLLSTVRGIGFLRPAFALSPAQQTSSTVESAPVCPFCSQ